MLDPLTLQGLTRNDLLNAHHWGDGYCFSCGERVTGAEDGTLSECDECGSTLVLSGGDLLRLAAVLAACASPYPDTL